MNYGNEDHINVALKTGKVELFKGKYGSNKQVVKMVPGQLVTYEKAKPEFHLACVNVDKYTSWIKGILMFQNDPLAEVLKKMDRWYNTAIGAKKSNAIEFLNCHTNRTQVAV